MTNPALSGEHGHILTWVAGPLFWVLGFLISMIVGRGSAARNSNRNRIRNTGIGASVGCPTLEVV
ncbi:hypothetical protein N7453_006575 [Penicillium expansum]|nr:hypothetical protein N7453_006575 [Penicillium expansum]